MTAMHCFIAEFTRFRRGGRPELDSCRHLIPLRCCTGEASLPCPGRTYTDRRSAAPGAHTGGAGRVACSGHGAGDHGGHNRQRCVPALWRDRLWQDHPGTSTMAVTYHASSSHCSYSPLKTSNIVCGNGGVMDSQAHDGRSACEVHSKYLSSPWGPETLLLCAGAPVPV